MSKTIAELLKPWLVSKGATCTAWFQPPLWIRVDVRHWHKVAKAVSTGWCPWGGEGGESAWARKLQGHDSLWQHRLACEDSKPDRQGCCLWSLFAPPSVLHLRALLSARHWIHLEWLRITVHFLKTQDPFSKLRGFRTKRDDVWRRRFGAEWGRGSPGNTD